MPRNLDHLYAIVYAAQDLAESEEGHEVLTSLIDDEIAPWLSEWSTWDEEGRRPENKPDNDYRSRPTFEALKSEFAFIGYHIRGGKKPKVWKF